MKSCKRNRKSYPKLALKNNGTNNKYYFTTARTAISNRTTAFSVGCFISSLRCAIQLSLIICFEFLNLVIQKRRSFLNFFFGFLSFRIPLSMSQFLITSHWISSELMTARRKGSKSKLTISVALIKSLSASGSLCFISEAQSEGVKTANV